MSENILFKTAMGDKDAGGNKEEKVIMEQEGIKGRIWESRVHKGLWGRKTNIEAL